jgi:hypothetical protein
MTDITALTTEQRSDILNREVARWVSNGWGTESVASTQAVLFKKRKARILLNLVLTVITGGLWGIVWIVLAVRGGGKRQVIFVNETGAVERR